MNDSTITPGSNANLEVNQALESFKYKVGRELRLWQLSRTRANGALRQYETSHNPSDLDQYRRWIEESALHMAELERLLESAPEVE